MRIDIFGFVGVLSIATLGLAGCSMQQPPTCSSELEIAAGVAKNQASEAWLTHTKLLQGEGRSVSQELIDVADEFGLDPNTFTTTWERLGIVSTTLDSLSGDIARVEIGDEQAQNLAKNAAKQLDQLGSVASQGFALNPRANTLIKEQQERTIEALDALSIRCDELVDLGRDTRDGKFRIQPPD